MILETNPQLGIIPETLQYGKEDYNTKLYKIGDPYWRSVAHKYYIFDRITYGQAWTLRSQWKIGLN